jgi:hypothetical protein
MGNREGAIFGANRAFSSLPIRLFHALKNSQKILFIQELIDRDFALGASRYSWQK